MQHDGPAQLGGTRGAQAPTPGAQPAGLLFEA